VGIGSQAGDGRRPFGPLRSQAHAHLLTAAHHRPIVGRRNGRIFSRRVLQTEESAAGAAADGNRLPEPARLERLDGVAEAAVLRPDPAQEMRRALELPHGQRPPDEKRIRIQPVGGADLQAAGGVAEEELERDAAVGVLPADMSGEDQVARPHHDRVGRIGRLARRLPVRPHHFQREAGVGGYRRQRPARRRSG